MKYAIPPLVIALILVGVAWRTQPGFRAWIKDSAQDVRDWWEARR